MLLPNLDKILAGCMGKRVAVVGDLMLDRYF
jgi:bifunctional ADP-heptose synthase (sugar kinase/adenylyltransferase)